MRRAPAAPLSVLMPQPAAAAPSSRHATSTAAQQQPYQPLDEDASSRLPAAKGLRKKQWMLRGIALAVLLGLVLATALTLGNKENLHQVLLWVHEHTVWGLVIFALLYIWFSVFFLPPALLAACAGALYGFLLAIPIVWTCAVAGETACFLLGRFLLRSWVKELTADWPLWLALNAALKEDGWKLVGLLRISPAIPFTLINYALGSSSLPFSHYFVPSVLGILPSLLIYIWLGSLAADVTEAVAGGGMAAPPAAKIAVIVVCVVSAIAVVVLSAVYTKRAIDSRLERFVVQEEVRVETQHLLLADHHAGRGSSQDDDGGLAPAGAGVGEVMVYVEEPRRYIAPSSAAAAGDGSSRGSDDSSSGSLGWVGRAATRLGLGGSSKKLKAEGAAAAEELVQQQQHGGAGARGGGGV